MRVLCLKYFPEYLLLNENSQLCSHKVTQASWSFIPFNKINTLIKLPTWLRTTPEELCSFLFRVEQILCFLEGNITVYYRKNWEIWREKSRSKTITFGMKCITRSSLRFLFCTQSLVTFIISRNYGKNNWKEKLHSIRKGHAYVHKRKCNETVYGIILHLLFI